MPLSVGITLTKKSTKMQKENNGENQRKTLNGENTATEIGEAQKAMPVTKSGVDAVDTREGTGAGKLANPGDGLAAASEVKPRVKSPTGKTGFVFRKVQLAKPRGKGMRRPDAPIPGTIPQQVPLNATLMEAGHIFAPSMVACNSNPLQLMRSATRLCTTHPKG